MILTAVACGGDTDDADAPPTTSRPDVTASTAPDATTDTTETTESQPTTTPAPTDDVASSSVDDATDVPVETEPPSTAPVSFGDHLAAGDCFNDSFDDQGDFDYSGVPQIVACDEAHDNEVVHVSSLDGGADAPYPPEEMWDDFFADVCGPAIEALLGVDGRPSALNGYFLSPDEDEWAAGSRSVPCMVYLPDAQLVGSVEGAGNDVLPAGFPAAAPLPDGIELSSAGTVEDSYSPSDRFTEEAGIDPSGFRVATFEGGDVDTVKASLEAEFADASWDVTLEDHWSGGVATAFYALERDGDQMIVEIWELEGGDSRLHYFYA